MNMKTIFTFLLSAFCFPLFGVTPFTYQFYNADGTAQTNRVTMEAWPRATNAWTVYGTNIIWGSQPITLNPDTNGYGTNYAFPNTYRLYVSNLNSSFFISLPDTSNQIALGSCLIAAPQVAGPLGFYALVTNWLGFAPATNNLAGIVASLGYTPLTNTYAAVTNVAGFVPATNGLAALTNTLTHAALVGIHGYTPATNTYAAFTNILGFVPATNAPLKLTAVVPFITQGSVTNQLYITNGIVTKTNAP
jgi:hypothetical protein